MKSRILLDTNVILDLLTMDETWFDWSARTIAAQQKSGKLVLNPVVCAEISRAFDHDWATLDGWRRAAGIELETLPFEASVVAAKAHAQYRRNGGQRIATLPDFFIGAHALFCGHALLTRDASRYKTYFPKLKIISP
jgi:predicted nucleic acid-binding protein